MTVRRQRTTAASRDRKIATWLEKRATGEYGPYILTSEGPSGGNRVRMKGLKKGRTHHLLSHNEQLFFSALELDGAAGEICEQYPLLPLPETVAIAQALGIEHPRHHNAPGQPYTVMTTDFVICDESNRCRPRRAWSVKREDALARARTCDLQRIELGYWAIRGVPWHIVTDAELRVTKIRNLVLLHTYAPLPLWLTDLRAPWRSHFATALARDARTRPTAEIVHSVAKRGGMSYANSAYFLRHHIWHNFIHCRLDGPIGLERSPDELELWLND